MVSESFEEIYKNRYKFDKYYFESQMGEDAQDSRENMNER